MNIPDIISNFVEQPLAENSVSLVFGSVVVLEDLKLDKN
jgi:hypothetical protein